MSAGSRSSRGERGFTLVEVLVATVIAALALGALYEGTLDGLVSARVSGQAQEALSRARSRLAAIGHGAPLQPGEQSGDDGGGYRWRTRIAQTGLAPIARGLDGAATRGPRVALYAVTVWVTYGAREVRLDSERIGAAAPQAP